MSSTTMRADVEERVREALIDFGADPDLINPDATWEELDIDSLDLVELSQIADEEWGVTLRTEDVREIQTVGQAVDLITARIG
jgi:acyl carrier protein